VKEGASVLFCPWIKLIASTGQEAKHHDQIMPPILYINLVMAVAAFGPDIRTSSSKTHFPHPSTFNRGAIITPVAMCFLRSQLSNSNILDHHVCLLEILPIRTMMEMQDCER